MNKLLILATLTIFSITLQSNAQMTFKIELNGGGGYTEVDPSKYSNMPLRDWGLGMSEVYLQVFPLSIGNLHIGAEFGSQYLFWYYYKQCEVCHPVTRDVDAWKLKGVMRYYLFKYLALEATAGLFNYQDYITPGLGGDLIINIPLGEKFYIPIKAGADIILDSDALMIPIGASAGFGYNFTLKSKE